MGDLGFRDGLMEQIRLRESRFHESAFLFVLASLEFLQARLPERRHVDGRELAHAVRELALERFGYDVTDHTSVNPEIGIYLNRLSDVLWLMARRAEARVESE